jgi:ribosomal protein L14E/L6E/L27E
MTNTMVSVTPRSGVENIHHIKLTSFVLYIVRHRLFEPVAIKKGEIDKCSFLRLSFVNKGLDAINLNNILHHKSSYNLVCLYHIYCNQDV